MHSLKSHLNFIVLLLPILHTAQTKVFNKLTLGVSLEEVTQSLKTNAKDYTLIDVASPTFPLAAQTESHLVCSQVQTQNGVLEKVAFTFADNQLVYVFAQGNAYQVFTQHRKDTAKVYLDYEVYGADKLFLRKKKDQAWILSDQAMHVNLFTWENPYINGKVQGKEKATKSHEIPLFLKMGGSLQELQPLLEKHSNFTASETLDGSDPNAQLQINCFGVNYLGFPRKVEARFGDNQLNVVWILTGKGEEDRVRKALVKQYGNPIYVTEDWEIFNDWQVALRKDKPEVLLMEKQIGQAYKSSYFKQ